jgi:endonuclease/exonuclease/phosphatase family metal-dependent hydrolase
MGLLLRIGAIVGLLGLLTATAAVPAPDPRPVPAGSARTAVTMSAASVSQRPAVRVTVMSFNVCGGVCRGGEVTRTAAYTARAAWRHKASVVLLQELCFSQFVRIRAQLGAVGYTARFAKATDAGACDNHDRKRGKAFGVAIFTRGPSAGTVVRRLPTTAGAEGRVLLGTNATIGGQRAFVAVVHLSPSPQAGLSRQLRAVAAYLNPRTRHPVIVGGDFNAPPAYAGMSRFYGRAAGGIGRFIEASEVRGGATARSGRATFDGGTKIDYIFLSERHFEKPSAVSVPTAMSDHRLYIGTALLRPL